MSGVDETPWICPSCAHFTVRRGKLPEVPRHECSVAGPAVDLVPYIDSDQALAIRNGMGRTLSRSIR